MKKNVKKIFAIALSLMLVLCFVGCGESSGPDTVVKTFCDSLQAFDLTAARDCLQDPSEQEDNLVSEEELAESLGSAEFLDYLKESVAKMTYEIGETTEDGDNGTVTVTFTYSDVSPVLDAAMDDFLVEGLELALNGAEDSELEDLLYDIFMEKTESEEITTTTCDITFDCVKVDDAWKIGSFSEETENAVLDVLTSNMVTAIDEWSDNMDE